jgi:hypothetical protein
MATSSHDTQPQETSLPPAMDRAEELVNVASQRVEHYASLAGKQLQKWLALAREEGEDIWAEAQHIRQGNRQTQTQAQTTPRKSKANHGKHTS